MMARKLKRTISVEHKKTYPPSQDIKRKKITAHLTSQTRSRSLKDSAFAKPSPAERAEEASQKNEERYRTVFDEMEEGYFEIDLAGSFTFVNDAVCRHLGYSREELIGMNNRVYADQENAKKMFQAFNNIYRTGQPRKIFDYEATRKDGTKAIIELSASLMRDSEGKSIGFRGVSRDVTERKRVEEALLNAAQQWRATFDGISDIVCLLGQEGRIIKCNKALTDLLGKPFSEIINHTHLEILHGAPMPIEECPVERLWKTHRRETDILLINDRWFSIAVDPLLDESGRLAGAVHIMSDVTEQKRAEEVIRESEKRYSQVIQNAVDIIYTTDANGNFTHANPAALTTTGYSLEELQRFNYLDLILPEHRDRVSKILISQFRERQATTYVEFPFFNKSGDVLWFGQNASLVIEREKPVGFHVIARDITERKQAEEALRRSEERYRTILDEMEEGYFETDLAGNLTFINDAGCRNLGYPREELIGIDNRTYADEENRKKTVQAFMRVYRTGQPCRILDYELTRKDGAKVIIELSVSLMRDSAGKPVGFRGISHHVTERKQAEEALRQSEERYRTIVEDMAEGYYEVDLTGKYTFGNKAILRFFGYSLDELMGLGYQQYSSPEAAKRMKEIFSEVYRTGIPSRRIDFEQIRKDGSVRMSEMSVSLVRNASGKPIGFRGIAIDKTEQKKAEATLRESEERYRTILESLRDAYYESDLAGNYTLVNPAACRHLGYSKEELIGMNFRQHSDEETCGRLKALHAELYRTGNPLDAAEAGFIRKDGTKGTVEISVSLIKDSEGKPIGFRGVSRDITERKKMEEALRESENKFRSLVEHSIVGVYLIQDGVFKYVNSRLAEIHGYGIEEMVDKMGLKQTTLPEDLSIVEGNINKRIKAEEESVHYEFRIITKSQEIRNVEVFGSRTMYQGRPAVIGTMLDVTERKRAEEALRQSEERYRTIIENIQDGYFELDLAGTFTFVNDAECVILGYSKDELIGMNNRQYTDKENAKKVFQAYNKLYRTGEPVKGLDLEVIRKDGTKAFDELSGSLIRDSEGKPIGFRGISRDVTERKQAEEALQESEKYFKEITENSSDIIIITDKNGDIKYCSRSIERFTGYKPEELIGRSTLTLIHPDDKKRAVGDFGKAILAIDSAIPNAFRIAHKDGSERYFEGLGKNLLDNPAVAGFIMNVRDITERKNIEEALRESENKFRGLVENSIVGVYLIQNGLFKYVNSRLAEIHGYGIEEMVDKMGLKQTTLPEDLSIVEGNINKRIKAEEESVHYEFRIITKSQEIRDVEVFGSRTMYQGRPAVIGTMLDITERKRAGEKLRHSEERYRTIIENIQDGYFENDLAGNFTFANDVICGHLRYTRDELIGMNYRQCTDEENAKNLYQHYIGLYRTGQPIKPFEAGYVGKDGTKLIAEISVSLIRNSEGKPLGFRGISRDITERKQAEEEKMSLQEQLRQSQKMEAIGQLAGGVAHDFNNLLTVIKGYSQLSLLDLKENDPLRGNIQEIEKATQRATDLTRQLLAFSRRQILDFKVLDLNALLKDLDKMLRRIIGEDIELVALLSEDLGRVKIDPGQIEQVIFNLAVNARDAMPSGGKLTIETANVELDEVYAHAHVSVIPGRYVSLSVSDTGVGMSQEVKEKVFEPFFTTKAKGKGTGLGLSMVYGIVKQSNGNIWVYSEPGRGTTFKINLPRIEEALDTLRGRDETDFFPRGSETILLVEDDELVRDLANRLLKQQGYKVLVAVNGEEALAVAREHDGEKIHLLLADIVMPQMGGKELADQLKIVRPDVKVLYTSGYADEAIVHHGVLDPGTHFLQKPFSLKTLSNKVREALDGEIKMR